MTPLHFASLYGKENVVKVLLEADANIQAKTYVSRILYVYVVPNCVGVLRCFVVIFWNYLVLIMFFILISPFFSFFFFFFLFFSFFFFL